jgi:hypothetical protein
VIREPLAIPLRDAEGPLVVAIDVGTTGVRTFVFDRRARPIGVSVTRLVHAVRTSRDGAATLDAERVARSVGDALDTAVARTARRGGDIAAVSMSTFWHSLVGVDGRLRPTTPLLTWADTRPRSAAAELRRELDAAVARVLTLKFRLGLFDSPYVREPDPARVRLPTDVDLARRAADESVTVLKNTRRLLPLRRRRPVLVVGASANDLRRQYGGWTVGWQGVPTGATPQPGVTVLRGVRALLGAKNVRTVARWRDTAAVRRAALRARVVLVVVGEEPYAEWEGDTRTAALAPDEARLVRVVEATRTPTVLVLVAGRPLMIGPLIRNASAFVMAYLPGSEGGTAIADVLFGRVRARGRLPFTWPTSIRDVPMALNERLDRAPATPLFRYGAGLSP